MTVGATDTWTESCDEIINDALANVGAIGPGEEASGVMRTHAFRALNRIVKAIDAEGQFLWRLSRLTATTTASQGYVDLHATAFDVDEPVNFLQAGGTTRVPMTPMSRDEYMALPDRTIESRTPTRYFIEKTLSATGQTALKMYLYPEPSTASDTIEYAAAIRAKDYVTGATTSDFPSNWIRCLVYGLTAEIAPAYQQPALVMTMGQMFEAEKTRQVGNDNEKQATFFVPFGAA